MAVALRVENFLSTMGSRLNKVESRIENYVLFSRRIKNQSVVLSKGKCESDE